MSSKKYLLGIILILIINISFVCWYLLTLEVKKPYSGEICLRGVVYYYSGDDFELARQINGKLVICGKREIEEDKSFIMEV